MWLPHLALSPVTSGLRIAGSAINVLFMIVPLTIIIEIGECKCWLSSTVILVIVFFLDITICFNTHQSLTQLLLCKLFCFPDLVLPHYVYTVITLDTVPLAMSKSWNVSIQSLKLVRLLQSGLSESLWGLTFYTFIYFITCVCVCERGGEVVSSKLGQFSTFLSHHLNDISQVNCVIFIVE